MLMARFSTSPALNWSPKVLTKGPGSVTVMVAPRSLLLTRALFWIRTIALVSAIACGLAFAMAILGTLAGAAAGEAEQSQMRPLSATRTYEGMVTDARCGAKHPAAMGRMAANCTVICVRAGEQFVLVDGNTTYVLEGDAVTLKRVAGQRVRIAGKLNGRSILVTSVSIA
jgi:hypothetical protein